MRSSGLKSDSTIWDCLFSKTQSKRNRMTTLRSFQNEIDEIHNRESSKQRVQTLLEKENKSRKVKVKEEGASASELVNADSPERQGPQDLEDGILVGFDWISLSLLKRPSLSFFQKRTLILTLPVIC